MRAQPAGGTRHQPRWVRPLPDDILVTFLTARDGGEDGRATAQDVVGELWSSRQGPSVLNLRWKTPAMRYAGQSPPTRP
ncbi:hypothetical protein [Streptomyces sp. NPDC058992]|uniref:hypothetical protein n=1 Tax=unclassified Streptomyces TaxID=2593676 RepID=UPI0036A9306B